MPFYRGRIGSVQGAKRYYRRKFRRSGLRPTTTPSLQQCQFYLDQLVIIGDPAGIQPSLNQPSFFIQSMSPWANLSQSGYDSRFDLYGFNYNSFYYKETNEAGSFSQFDAARLCELWFADGVDLDGAPSSVVGFGSNSHGPFVTLPPVTNPIIAPEDDLMPVRTLKRTYFNLGLANTTNTFGAPDGSLSIFRGSGRVRVKRRLDDKTEWFWGLYGVPPDPSTQEFGVRCIIGGVAYYKLRR